MTSNKKTYKYYFDVYFRIDNIEPFKEMFIGMNKTMKDLTGSGVNLGASVPLASLAMRTGARMLKTEVRDAENMIFNNIKDIKNGEQEIVEVKFNREKSDQLE